MAEKKGGVIRFFAVVVITGVAIGVILGWPRNGDSNTKSSSTISRENKIRSELSYLMTEVDEIEWIEVDSNVVYVGFEPLPSDWEMIIKGAALRANRAIGSGAHVWAVKAANKGWRPGDSSYYGEVTARYGKIE